ncbi:GspH/FimT family protein [Dyella sp.]|uniref:GspH/FimT family protein n=1 Tax=Dyella sp. TaxID=1869338 RepID=UPI002D76F5FB|nr:GspH/FimT family pseudopilin [Dyella sp.]HET7329942.1 GspH/FimT family pseudopilin [Dyella sp.]
MQSRPSRGFGLAEQIIALAVLAALIALAVPSFHRLLETHELRAAQSDYLAALQHARNLAVNEQVRAIFCPSRDQRTCSGDGSWGDSWLIGKADPDNPSQLLGPPRYVGQKRRDALVVASSSKLGYVGFDPMGTSVNTNQTLSFCVRDETQQIRKVVIARSGRIRGEQGDASPCAPQDGGAPWPEMEEPDE